METATETSMLETAKREELQERYGVKQAAFYRRCEFLSLKARKKGKRTYYDAGQIERLDALHQHIQEFGVMDGFFGGSLATVAPSEIEQHAEDVEAEPITDAYAALIRSAQEHGAGALIAKYQISAAIQENPDLLPDDLRSQVNQAQAAAAPKSQSPQEVAAGIMAKFRSQSQQPQPQQQSQSQQSQEALAS